MDLLKRVGLEKQAKQYPATLSGGQQQRVSIARALAVKPHAILFDEPTSALDPELVNEVLQVIRELAKEDTTMVIVTHEMQFAKEVADHVIFMADGHIIEQGTPEQVIEHSLNPRTQRFLRQMGDEKDGSAIRKKEVKCMNTERLSEMIYHSNPLVNEVVLQAAIEGLLDYLAVSYQTKSEKEITILKQIILEEGGNGTSYLIGSHIHATRSLYCTLQWLSSSFTRL